MQHVGREVLIQAGRDLGGAGGQLRQAGREGERGTKFVPQFAVTRQAHPRRRPHHLSAAAEGGQIGD